MQTTYKGIIFDFNGVLLWDAEQQETAWKEYSKILRGYELTDEEIKHKVHGIKNRLILEYLLERNLSADEVLRMTKEKEDIYRNLCLNQKDKFVLSPGAIRLFEFLKNNKISFTIATASEESNVDFFIEHLQLNKWFEKSLIVFDDGSHHGKPHPDIYQLASKKIQLNPGECIVIEDAIAGIESARKAGIGFITALGPKKRHKELCKLEGVNLVIEKLSDLPVEKLFNQVLNDSLRNR